MGTIRRKDFELISLTPAYPARFPGGLTVLFAAVWIFEYRPPHPVLRKI
jgi:hypothetical protein